MHYIFLHIFLALLKKGKAYIEEQSKEDFGVRPWIAFAGLGGLGR